VLDILVARGTTRRNRRGKCAQSDVAAQRPLKDSSLEPKPQLSDFHVREARYAIRRAVIHAIVKAAAISVAPVIGASTVVDGVVSSLSREAMAPESDSPLPIEMLPPPLVTLVFNGPVAGANSCSLAAAKSGVYCCCKRSNCFRIPTSASVAAIAIVATVIAATATIVPKRIVVIMTVFSESRRCCSC